MATGLPPPPINDQPGSFTWLEWYRQLRNYISTNGSVPWYVINFAGSNITDIATRDHDQLQNLDGGTAGEHYHLTAAQHSALTAGPHNNLSGLQGGTSDEYYHLTAQQYAAISNTVEILSTAATTNLPTTPTVLILPTVVLSSGITYNTSTGEFVFTNGGSYSFTMLLNAQASAANKKMYFYAELDTGGGYAIRQYSARDTLLKTTTTEQTVFVSSNYFPAGTKLKLFLWGDATVSISTVDLPGTTPGTATIPACRIMFAGSL